MTINELGNKRILILGFGREGLDTFRFLRKIFPQKTLGIADKSKIKGISFKKARFHFGENYLNSAKNYDVVIKSPGIPFKILPKSVLKKVVTPTEIFFDNCRGQIVGITGTKGKRTTTSMIYEILKAGGYKAHLIGNIGKPVLNLLPDSKENDVYAYEMSSHQLFSLKKSPHVAVFLNIFQEHLDYYRSFAEYARAKANITLHQAKNDYLVFNAQDKLVKKFSLKSKAKKIPIKGEYYELDKAAARAVGKIFKVPAGLIEKTLKNFKYLAHRLELVGTFKGITFYNDSLATIPEATISAMDKLGRRVETIMLGGYERNIDFKKLAEKVLQYKIKNVILFPTTGQRIWREIVKAAKKRGVPRHFFVSPHPAGAGYMQEAVKLAFDNTARGKICLLSTASPSFSMFKDYREKGELFVKYVKKYGRQ
jgi:UDP-N-acetylmuramoylalanine--D-glutamate ligase